MMATVMTAGTVAAQPAALPAVPAFEVTAGAPGAKGVRELLSADRALLGTDVTVAGYVLWIYDCPTAVRRKGESAAATKRRIEADPTLCERPKFYLGDHKDAALETSLWIVDVPRPYNKLEVDRIPIADRTHPDRCEPVPRHEPPRLCFPLAVGDYVTVTGTFATTSPHAERNSDGLVVFKGQARTQPPARPTMIALPSPTVTSLPALVATPVVKKPSSWQAHADSVTAANEGNKAYAQQDYAKAKLFYDRAVALWDGNHAALFGLAGVAIFAVKDRPDWAGTAAAAAQAFALAPGQPLYASLWGRATYELAIAAARGQPNAGPIDQTRAEQLFRYAIKLDPTSWREHYYLGRILRDSGRMKAAADELTVALSSSPTESAPWVALGELYRKYGYPAESIAVTTLGVSLVKGDESSDVWFVLGLAHHALHQDEQAVLAFTEAVTARPGNAKALFQRGQTFHRLKRPKQARADLQAYLAAGTGDPLADQQAKKLLVDLGVR